MRKMAVLLSGSGRTLDNFHERIEVDGRGEVPAVGEGFLVGSGFVIFAEHLHVHFRISVADRRVGEIS